MKKLLILLTIIVNLNSALITGGQDRLSITGGSMNVTSAGVTKTVNSGQITFIQEGQAPSDARKLKPSDLKEITNGLKMTNASRLINLKFAPVKHIIAKKIRRFLIRAGIDGKKITFKKSSTKVYLYIKQIDINKIKNIYPLYYKAVSKYYIKNKVKLKKTAKTPTIVVKLNMMKKYHKSIFKKYN